MRRGEVYLVNFKKRYRNEFGKTRPALIFQTDLLNKQLWELPYPTIAVIPLSTDTSVGGSFRVKIASRDRLEKDSEVVINWICTLDASLLQNDTLLTTLTSEELKEVETRMLLFLGYQDRSFLAG